jgi:hypothetical protein
MDVGEIASSGACDRFSRSNLKLKTKTACRCDDTGTVACALRVFSRVRVTRQARLGATSPLPLSNFNGQPVSPCFPLRPATCTFLGALLFIRREVLTI